MTAIKPFLNQLFEPLLLLTSFPIPLFSPSHSPTSSNAFDEIEFPRRGFPLAITDWRDMLVYLYTAHAHDIKDELHANMRLSMRKHAEGLRIGEIRRYERDGHHIVVAHVVEEEGGKKSWVVRSGVRLLRFERGAAVLDVAEVDDAFAGPMIQEPAPMGAVLTVQQDPVVDQHHDSKATGLGKDIIVDDLSRPSRVLDTDEPQLQQVESSKASGTTKPAYDSIPPPPTNVTPLPDELATIEVIQNPDIPSSPPPPISPTEPESQVARTPHPSISIYSANIPPNATKPSRQCASGNEGSFVDTVQSTIERDLQGWTLVETVRPKALYLHHLAILLAETHEYSVSADAKTSVPHTIQDGGGGLSSCIGFSEMVMTVVKDETGVTDTVSVAVDGVVPAGPADILSPEKTKITGNSPEAVKKIRSRYHKAKIDVEKKIYGSVTVDVQNNALSEASDLNSKKATIEHRDYAQPIN